MIDAECSGGADINRGYKFICDENNFTRIERVINKSYKYKECFTYSI